MARYLERFLLAGRWLLVPFYLGLLIGLVALLFKAGQHVLHFTQGLVEASESDVVLSVLGLIDLTLVASLVLIVIYSGYESFVTAIKQDANQTWPLWLTQIDFSGLKLKLMASIVAISAIQLLRVFMSAADRSDREIMWYAIIHVVFVVSGLLLAITDRITDSGHAAPGPSGDKPPTH